MKANPKRGYSRAFTPHGNTGKAYKLADIPAGLWHDVKTKSARDGISVRAVILGFLKGWVSTDESRLQDRSHLQ
jgi:hypothetical protein